MLNKYLIFFISLLILLSSCESVKRGLTGQKKNTTDEFLVEKKDPLVLPPNFDDLPEPDNIDQILEQNEEIEDIISIGGTNTETQSQNTSGKSSVEESILGKIKNN